MYSQFAHPQMVANLDEVFSVDDILKNIRNQLTLTFIIGKKNTMEVSGYYFFFQNILFCGQQ